MFYGAGSLNKLVITGEEVSAELVIVTENSAILLAV